MFLVQTACLPLIGKIHGVCCMALEYEGRGKVHGVLTILCTLESTRSIDPSFCCKLENHQLWRIPGRGGYLLIR